MYQIYLNPEESKKLKEIKQRDINKRIRWFCRKKLNHLNSAKFRLFWEKQCSKVKFSHVLYEIHFKSSFSFYLYLYLKSLAVGYDVEGDEEFSISQPVDVNFGRLVKISDLTMNTVKKAFHELVEVGLLLYRDDFKPKYHNSTKSVMVLNDKQLVGYDQDKKRIVYSIKTY
jgi:hypothetical protein